MQKIITPATIWELMEEIYVDQSKYDILTLVKRSKKALIDLGYTNEEAGKLVQMYQELYNDENPFFVTKENFVLLFHQTFKDQS